MDAYRHDKALAKAIDSIERTLKHTTADCIWYPLDVDERQLDIGKDVIRFYKRLGHRCNYYGNSIMIEAHN